MSEPPATMTDASPPAPAPVPPGPSSPGPSSPDPSGPGAQPSPPSFTRRQALQNAAFLAALRRSGNARQAARDCDLHRATLTKRRARHPAFAADWDAALALAHSSLVPPQHGERDRQPQAGGGVGPSHTTPPATTRQPPEPRLVRTRSGRLQLRQALPGGIARADEQAFLAALAASANIRLSARAAGFSHASFYARARANPAFAREMRRALETGYERVELALLASIDPASHADDAWAHNDPPPLPRMTVAEALQLLHLHHRTVHLQAERPDRRRARGEGTDAWSARASAC